LLALSLAVGLLIDDAIVIIENIYRHMDEGETPLEAAKSASDEIGLAVMSVTFTLVAVFVPVAFMSGIVGRFFFQFGITVTVAVLVSLFVALSLTPMLSSKWLKEEHISKEGNVIQKGLYYFNHFFDSLSAKYISALRWSINHRITIVVGSILIFVFSFYLMKFLGSEFIPEQDQGEFEIVVNAAPGSSIIETNKIMKQIESVVRKKPGVVDMLTTIGSGNNPVTEGDILVKLVEKGKRNYSTSELMSELRHEIHIPGADISYDPPSGPGGQQKPVIFSVRGENLTVLDKLAKKVEKIVKTTPGAVDVDNTLQNSKPELRITVERQKASELGVNVNSIATTVRALVDGYDATKFQQGEDQYNVKVRLRQSDRKTLADLSNITVKSTKKTATGGTILVPLSDVAFINNGVGPSVINRYDRKREIEIQANLSGKLLGEVLAPAQKRISKLNMPPGYSVEVAGTGEQQSKSFINILLSLALAIIFVYIVLASQFESFVYPFSIMLALPMSIIGAVLALIAFNGSLSIMSMIGIIMLMGLVTKNGILLVDYINIERDRGLSRSDAILSAGPVRLRPILMTTFAMVFGMIPVAFSLGTGSELRAPMGQAVIGGLITSTLLTLFIVPVAYSILDDIPKWFVKLASIFGLKKKTISIEPGEAES